MTVDILAIGAHPDDVELGVGGTLCKLAKRDFSVGILDLTRGELGTRGTPAERATEAAAAARILGAAERENVGFPDGALANTRNQRQRVITFLRRLRPKILLLPMAPDRHPDHSAAHELVRDANYFAGLRRIDTDQEPHRAPYVYYYYPYEGQNSQATFVVDVTDTFKIKLKALKAHHSQFHNPDYKGEETWISTKDFWEGISARAMVWGARIGAKYGEPFFTDGPVPADLPPGLV